MRCWRGLACGRPMQVWRFDLDRDGPIDPEATALPWSRYAPGLDRHLAAGFMRATPTCHTLRRHGEGCGMHARGPTHLTLNGASASLHYLSPGEIRLVHISSVLWTIPQDGGRPRPVKCHGAPTTVSQRDRGECLAEAVAPSDATCPLYWFPFCLHGDPPKRANSLRRDRSHDRAYHADGHWSTAAVRSMIFDPTAVLALVEMAGSELTR